MSLLDEGVRSEGWDLSPTVCWSQAKKPHLQEMVALLTGVITGTSELSELTRRDDWLKLTRF